MKKRNYGNSRVETAAANVAEALKQILEGPERRQLLGAAFRLCGNVGQADELVEDACYQALRNCRRYDPARRLMPWLMRLLINVYKDARRRKTALSIDRHAGNPGSEGLGLLQVLGDGSEPALDRALRLEREAAITRQLGALKKIHREAIVVRDFMGLSYAMGAKRLKLRVGTLKSRVSRGHAAFRREFREEVRP